MTPKWLAAGLVALATMLFVAPELPRAARSPEPSWRMAEVVDDGGVRLGRSASVEGAWAPVDRGLGLPPRGEGAITLRVPVPEPGGRIVARLWLAGGGPLRTRVAVSSDGREYAELARDRPLRGAALDLSAAAARGAEAVWLRIEARHLGDGPPRRVLRRLEVTATPPWRSLPRLPLGFALALVGLGAGRLALAAGLRPAAAVVAGAAGWAVALGLDQAAPAAWSRGWTLGGWRLNGALLAYGGQLAGAAVLARRGVVPREGLARAASSAMLGVLASAWLARWEALARVVAAPLKPDPDGVVRRAAVMRHPYDFDFREPLWVWATWLFSALPVPDEVAIRLFSVAASLVWLVVTYRVVRDGTGSATLALLTLALLARHPYLVELSVLGLRIELYGLTLLAVAGIALARRPGARPGRAGVALAGWTAAAALTQFSSLLTTLPLAAWGAWRGRVRWGAVAGAASLALLVLAPYFWENWRRHGDPLWTATMIAVYYRNYEFAAVRGTGCPGCPSAAEFQRNAFLGPRLTLGEYVLGMHTVLEVASRIADGYLAVFLRPGPLLERLLGVKGLAGWGLYVAGLVLLLCSPARELLLFPFLALNLLAFLVPLQIDERLLAHLVPAMALALAVPPWHVARLVASRVSAGRARPSTPA